MVQTTLLVSPSETSLFSSASRRCQNLVFTKTYCSSYLDDNGATDPNSATGNAGAAILMAFINDTKTMLSDLSTTLKVGNADAGSFFNDLVLDDVDYRVDILSNSLTAGLPTSLRCRWPMSIHGSPMSVLMKLRDGPGVSSRTPVLLQRRGYRTHQRCRLRKLDGLRFVSICFLLYSCAHSISTVQKSSDAGNESNGPSMASEGNLQVSFLCKLLWFDYYSIYF